MDSKRYILVSGGAGGIGSALCRLLPEYNFTPIIADISNPLHAEAIARECDGLAMHLDLSSDASIAQALSQLPPQLSGVVLAASPPPDLLAFGKLGSEVLLRQFRINVVGPQLLLAGLIKSHFRKTKSGTVVGVLSEAIGNAERAPATGMGAYVIAKIALRGMLDVCAAEYSWLKVRTVSPGFTRTKMLDVFDERYLEMAQNQKAFSSPEDTARLILNEIMS